MTTPSGIRAESTEERKREGGREREKERERKIKRYTFNSDHCVLAVMP